MGEKRLAQWTNLFAVVTTLGLSPPPAVGQACIQPDVAQHLGSCDGFERDESVGLGRHRPAALPSPEAAPAERARPRPRLRPPLQTSRERGIRDQQFELLMRERRVLERLVARTAADAPQRADVLQRLALTLAEIVRERTARARGLDEPIFVARQRHDADAVRRMLAEQASYEDGISADRLAAIRALAQLVAGFPSRPQLDESLRSLALLLEEAGERARARQVYHRILRDYPSSRYVTHAYLAFAEWRFEQGELTEAAQFYERVLRTPAADNPLYGYALYKLAWVHENLEDHARALEGFARVLRHAAQFSDRPSSSALARQTRRELVLPYSHVGRPDRALVFFRRLAEDDAQALRMLKSLAQLYSDEGRWPEAIATHHILMAQAPASDQLCDWQQRVFEATISSRPKTEQVREARRLLDVHRVFVAGQHPDSSRRRCSERAATSLILLSTAWHREAVGTEQQPGTRDRDTMQYASVLYDLLARSFPNLSELRLSGIDARDVPSTAEIAMFQGELLYELQRWDLCAQAFERALAHGPAAELAADATYGAVLCYDRHLGSRRPPSTDRDAALTARALDDAEQRMATTFHRFACTAPQHAELPNVLYRWARLHFEANRFEQAAVLFHRVATDHPASEVAEYAANLYLDSVAVLAERRGRTACYRALERNLEPLEQTYCATPSEHGSLCETVARLRCELPARRVQAMRGQPEQRARILLRVVREQRCADAPRHLYNAAMYFEQARLLGAAIRVRSVLVEQYPEHALARRAIYLIAANYHALAIYEQAATYYEQYVRRDGTCDPEMTSEPCPDASEGLRLAVRFRLGLGQTALALEGADEFQRRFGRTHPRIAANVAFDIGGIYERSERWPRMVQHYRAFLRQHRRHATPAQRAAAQVAIARAWIRHAHRGRATSALEAAVHIHEAGGEEALAAAGLDEESHQRQLSLLRSAVAEARYELAESLRLEFEALRFPTFHQRGGIEQVDRWATRELLPWVLEKRRLIAAAEEAYGRVAPLGVPRWRIAAASRLGDMYLSLVEQVRASPVPDVIARYPEALTAYEDALDRVTEEPAQVAITRYEACLGTATAARWFDRRSLRCERALHSLDPARYPVASELRGSPSFERSVFAQPRALASRLEGRSEPH